MIEIFSAHLAKRKQPLNMPSDDVKLFQHEFQKEIREAHVLKLSNAVLLKDIILHGAELKKYLPYSYPFGLPALSILKRLTLLLKPKHKIERGVWVFDDWSPGYFHWLTDALPRLMLSERVDPKLPVLLPDYYEQISFVRASLQLLKREVTYYPSNQPCKVDELVLTSHTANTGNYNHTLIKELRERFLTGFSNESGRKVYISRSKATKRKVKNEAAVIEVLKRFDFEVHHFEDYAFEHQVQLMAETKMLVSLHGSGLTNMLFMPAGGKVLELRNAADKRNNCFFSLASDLDLDYYYLLNAGDQEDTFAVDITVDAAQLEEVLKLSGV